MIDSAIIPTVTAGITFVIFAYAAYWAFNIRRALAVGVYRSQAMGVGLISLGWMTLDVEVSIVSGIFHIVGGKILLFTYVPVLFAISLFTFYSVDASARAARRSEPLFRDTLHWSVVRNFCWGLIVAGLAFFIVVYGLQFYVNPILSLSWVTAPFVMGVSGAGVLPLVASRSGDVTLRRHLGWFGLFVIFELILAVASAATGLLNLALVQQTDAIIVFVLLVFGGYSLYRSEVTCASEPHVAIIFKKVN